MTHRILGKIWHSKTPTGVRQSVIKVSGGQASNGTQVEGGEKEMCWDGQESLYWWRVTLVGLALKNGQYLKWGELAIC